MRPDIWAGHTPPAGSGGSPGLTAYPVDGDPSAPAVLVLPGLTVGPADVLVRQAGEGGRTARHLGSPPAAVSRQCGVGAI